MFVKTTSFFSNKFMRSDDAVKDSGKRVKDSGKRVKDSAKRVKDSGTKAVTPSVSKPTDEQQNNKETNEVVQTDDAKNDSGTKPVTRSMAKKNKTDDKQLEKP